MTTSGTSDTRQVSEKGKHLGCVAMTAVTLTQKNDIRSALAEPLREPVDAQSRSSRRSGVPLTVSSSRRRDRTRRRRKRRYVLDAFIFHCATSDNAVAQRRTHNSNTRSPKSQRCFRSCCSPNPIFICECLVLRTGVWEKLFSHIYSILSRRMCLLQFFRSCFQLNGRHSPRIVSCTDLSQERLSLRSEETRPTGANEPFGESRVIRQKSFDNSAPRPWSRSAFQRVDDHNAVVYPRSLSRSLALW